MQAPAPPAALGPHIPVAERKHTLSVLDTVAIIVGVVIGAGIFRFPSLVAANAGSEAAVLLIWLAGGIVSLVGALCYAELATAYPHSGGEYHYLTRAFGRNLAFLFAWARMTVIQTGTIAISSFLIGDYLSEVYSFGAFSPPLYAAAVVVILTAVNITGFRQGKWTQNVLTAAIVIGLISVIFAGLSITSAAVPAATEGAPQTQAALGLAMIFVLYTYGGWNEAAYVSAEVRGSRRNMVRALMYGIALITAIYLVVNYALLRSLGLAGMAESNAVAADLMRNAVGEGGAKFISVLIAIAALSTVNATIITGARTNYALGRDFPFFGFLGRWKEESGTPVNALVVQGAIALILVLMGAMTQEKDGLQTMVDYTAPVFWFFFFLVGVALLVLRRKDPAAERPFRVPLYPVTPLLFCAFCLYMLRSSVAYTGIGAFVGIGVLLVGLPLLLLANNRGGKHFS